MGPRDSAGLRIHALQLEWPEEHPEPGKGCCRYDLAILRPSPNGVMFPYPKAFEDGAKAPAVVIEIGLDANNRLDHIVGDHLKSTRNGIAYPYLVDLGRERNFPYRMERLVNTIDAPFKVAFCNVQGGKRAIELLNDESIRKLRRGAKQSVGGH